MLNNLVLVIATLSKGTHLSVLVENIQAFTNYFLSTERK